MIKRIINWLKDKHILHTWVEEKTQHIKGVLYGLGWCGFPSERIVYVCKKCGKKKFIFLNLSTPYSDRYNEDLWI